MQNFGNFCDSFDRFRCQVKMCDITVSLPHSKLVTPGVTRLTLMFNVRQTTRNTLSLSNDTSGKTAFPG